MYFLIIAFGFLMAMRGAKPVPLQRPAEGFLCVWREATDFLLTIGLMLALEAAATAFDRTQLFSQDYTILIFGVIAYLLSRHQKKTDIFFLAVTAIAFRVHSRQAGLLYGISLAWAVSVGIALFQTCFLGLRYKLLFSRAPVSMKGWPVLCLLAAFIAISLGSIRYLVF